MNKDAARQDDRQRWRFSRASLQNEGKPPAPIGYCADGCPGHDTPKQARDHYVAFLLDHLNFIDDSDEPTDTYPCEVPSCRNECDGGVQAPYGPRLFHLCADHRTREDAETVIEREIVSP